MPRIKLTTMLDDVKQTLEPEPSVDSTPNPQPDKRPEPRVADLALDPSPQQQVPAPVESAPTKQAVPRPAARREKPAPAPAPSVARVHYTSLVRKEARLRDDQIEALTLRARKLSRNKVGTDERITDNTLIRIAVDLLLAREADLAGNSEAELRQSVGL